MTHETLMDALQSLRELKMKIRDIEMDLCHEIEIVEPVAHAVAIGLVKPNFSTPQGFMRMLRDKYSKEPKPTKVIR